MSFLMSTFDIKFGLYSIFLFFIHESLSLHLLYFTKIQLKTQN